VSERRTLVHVAIHSAPTGRRLAEMEPPEGVGPTQDEDVVPISWTRCKHRRNSRQPGARSATRPNAHRHARTHAADRASKIDRGGAERRILNSSLTIFHLLPDAGGAPLEAVRWPAQLS